MQRGFVVGGSDRLAALTGLRVAVFHGDDWLLILVAGLMVVDGLFVMTGIFLAAGFKCVAAGGGIVVVNSCRVRF